MRGKLKNNYYVIREFELWRDDNLLTPNADIRELNISSSRSTARAHLPLLYSQISSSTHELWAMLVPSLFTSPTLERRKELFQNFVGWWLSDLTIRLFYCYSLFHENVQYGWVTYRCLIRTYGQWGVVVSWICYILFYNCVWFTHVLIWAS